MHDVMGTRGAVSFAGSGPLFDGQQMMELMYISIHVFQRLAELRNLDSRQTEVLTDRETDCLNWTAAGKTSAEIAGSADGMATRMNAPQRLQPSIIAAYSIEGSMPSKKPFISQEKKQMCTAMCGSSSPT